ncbi:MAG: SRPBCC family protein, partial [Ktedonobacterales bacterium]
MREGSATTTVAAAPAVAFALLADPCNAPLWFAGGALANEPQGPLRADMTWAFLQGPTGKERSIPARMALYDPPTRFAWQTTNPTGRDNLRWEVTCIPDSPDSSAD